MGFRKGRRKWHCTRALPCLTLAFALTQTAAPVEIDVLDPGAFSKVTINSAISIVNDGAGVAAIGIASGNAITINARASDNVHLRGLTIKGIGGAANGMLFSTGLNLALENCAVRVFSTAGVKISPSTSSSFSVSNTIASNNSGTGVLVKPTGSAVVTGLLSKVTANNDFGGIVVDGELTTGASLNVTIADSAASNNAFDGIDTGSSSGQAATTVMLRNVVASYNGIGLNVGANTILRVAHSVVTGNSLGVHLSAGLNLYSYADNDIEGNTTNNTGVLTTISMH